MAEAGVPGVQNRHRVAIVVHVYYPDIWREFTPLLLGLDSEFDLFLTIPHEVAIDEAGIRRDFPAAHIHRCENRGRDVAPFLAVFSAIARQGYDCICKLHTKSSPHLIDGRVWRDDMLRKLIGSSGTVARIARAFAEHPEWGVIAPSGHVVPHELYWHPNAANVSRLAASMGIDNVSEAFSFVAGSMFWFRPQALLPLADMQIGTSDFEPENGAYDGTLAHAFERLFGLIVKHEGYGIAESDGLEVRSSEIPYHFRLLAAQTVPPAEADQLEALRAELHTAMARITSDEARITSADARIQDLTGALAAATSAVEALQAELALAQARIADDDTRIANLTGQLAIATDGLHRTSTLLEQARVRIADDDARIEGLSGELAAVTHRLQDVLASASWRWTSPLRTLKGFYLRARK